MPVAGSSRILLAIAALAYLVSCSSILAAENPDGAKWLGKSPNAQTRAYEIQCDSSMFLIVIEMQSLNGWQVSYATESGTPVAAEVKAALNGLLSSFERIENIQYSCGNVAVRPGGKVERNGTEVKFMIFGRSKNEPATAFDDCWIRRGFYDDTTEGSVAISKDKIILKEEPGNGVCITEFGPKVEIDGATSMKDESL